LNSTSIVSPTHSRGLHAMTGAASTVLSIMILRVNCVVATPFSAEASTPDAQAGRRRTRPRSALTGRTSVRRRGCVMGASKPRRRLADAECSGAVNLSGLLDPQLSLIRGIMQTG
jgi:hypothetical protein